MSNLIVPVILTGGQGTRLWPLSRSSAPKFLHDLTGSGRSLVQATVNRVAVRFLLFASSSLCLMVLIFHAAIPIFDLHLHG